MSRRFPPPWSIEESSACFIVRDHDKQALAYVYYETESGRRSSDGGPDGHHRAVGCRWSVGYPVTAAFCYRLFEIMEDHHILILSILAGMAAAGFLVGIYFTEHAHRLPAAHL
jgi:hypothetical protein